MLLGYARVSKAEDQDTAAQVGTLKAADCTRIYEARASGGRWDRPELHRLLDHLREGDTVVVWKLDRLTRSLKDLLHILEKIDAAGARFRSVTEAIDTSGPAGRMVMQMLDCFAEFERAMVRERTRAGLKAARERGRKGGRRPKLLAHLSNYPDAVVSRLAPVGYKHINMRGVLTFDLSGYRSSLLRQTPSRDAGRASS